MAELEPVEISNEIVPSLKDPLNTAMHTEISLTSPSVMLKNVVSKPTTSSVRLNINTSKYIYINNYD